MSAGLPLRLEGELVARITIDGGDHYWTFGRLVPGPAYERCRALLEAQYELSELSDSDSAPPAAEVVAEKLLDSINGLALTLGDPPERVRDLKFIDSELRVEFKIQEWA